MFHVRITFKEVKGKDGKGPIAIADTVHVISNEETKVLTESIPRKYKLISYTLDDEDEDEEEDEADEREQNGGKENGDAEGEIYTP